MIKMKPVDVKSNTYKKKNQTLVKKLIKKNQNLKLVILSEYQNRKIFFQKVTLQIGLKRIL